MRLLLRSISFSLLCFAFGSVGAQTQFEPYTFTTVVGIAPDSTDGIGDAARFFQPSGIVADSGGNIFLSDTFNQTIRRIGAAGDVTTIAGLTGSAGSDDGLGNAARFWYPTGLVLDDAGNLFVSSRYAIRKVTPSGAVSTFVGSPYEYGSADGIGTAARLSLPNGIAIDAAGNLYVADGNNHTIRKITPAAVTTTLAGLAGASGTTDGTGSAARFNNPRGLAIDRLGNVYVADAYNHTIRKISPAGAVTTLAGLPEVSGCSDGSGSSARFLYPWSLSLDNAGNIFVADAYNNTIRKVTSTGLVTTVAGLAQNQGNNDGTGSAARFSLPQALTIDPNGNVIVADTNNSAIRRITPSFSITTPWGLASPGNNDGTLTAARLQGPADAAVDNAGNIYIADSSNQTIRKVSPIGLVTTLAGSAGNSGSSDGIGSAARFTFPSGVAVDSGGNVYVADQGNCTIRKITPNGTATTLAGLANSFSFADGTGSAARFNNPFHLAVDREGNVYVADSGNFCIRKITPSGTVTTLAGSAGNAGSSDGQGNAARFNFPGGIAVGPDGDVWVADQQNHTIRKITATGLVTTIAGFAGDNSNKDGVGNAARFAFPEAVAVGPDSNIFVADSGNQSIRRITPAGVVTTLAGSGYLGSKNGPGSVARFWNPQGIAVDSSGKVYVADSNNNAIRVGVPSPPPANDNLANASVISSNSGSVDGNNFAATEEVGEPQSGYAGGHSVWFKWTAPQDGVFVFQLSSSSFNTFLGIYTGSQINALTFFAGSSYNDRVVFNATAGVTYDIVVDGDNGESGSFTLTWKLVLPPPNDDFANATAISGISGSVSGDTTAATKEPGEPNHGGYPEGHSVWYQWTAPQDGFFNFQLSSFSFSTLLGSYTGSQVNTLITVAAGRLNQPVTFHAVAGRTYSIAVDGDSGSSGSFTLTWSQVTPPSNDNFANAVPITGPSGSASGSNIAATKEGGEPYHADNAGGHSVWYKWTAPKTGVYAFEFNTSFYSNLLAVYTGAQVNALTPIASASFNSSVAFRAVAGTSYYIAVDGYGGDSGSFTLTWRLAIPPSNDDFVNAAALAGASGTLVINNVDATREAGEPAHAGYTGGHSIWYKWTAPLSGVFTFQVTDSSISDLLGIYTGSQVSALTTVATVSFGNSANFRASIGTTYYVAVDGYGGRSGSCTLTWRSGNPPPNDDFANAATITDVSGALTANNADATTETGEPNHAGYPCGHSVWYKWIAPQSGAFTFQEGNPSFNDLVGIYTGSQVDGLTSIAYASFGGSATFHATAGTIYYVAVDCYSGASVSFTLTWGLVNTPSNDDFVNAALINGSSGSVSSTNNSATAETNEPYHGGHGPTHSVWYKWTAPQSGAYAFQISSSSFSSVLAIYSGSQISVLTGVASASSTNIAGFSATAGTSYYLAIDSAGSSTGSFTLAWNSIARPANDDFADAAPISGASGAVAGSNVAASIEPGEPNHGYYFTDHSVWYRWTAPQDGVFAFQESSSAFDGPLAIYAGSQLNALTVIAESIPAARMAFHATAGMTYYIVIGSYDSRAGSFTLAWEPASPPANDDFIHARAIGDSTGDSVGSLADATLETGEANLLGDPGQRSVWYSWTAPSDGAFAFLLSSSEAELAVYLGTQVDKLSYLTSSYYTDGAPRLVIRAVAGTSYKIAIGSHDPTDFTLSWRRAAPPPNDDFANAQQISGASGSVAGTTLDASAEFGQPFNTFSAGASVWYAWTAPQSGRYVFQITYDASLIAPYFTAYEGSTLNSLAGLASSFYPGIVEFDASAGSVYYLALDAFHGTDVPFTLQWRAVPMQSIYEPYGFTTVLGNPPGKADGAVADARWNQPSAIAFDQSGNAYVADSRNHTIRKITSSGTVSTLAGSAGHPGSSDGQGSAARFNFPGGIAVDSAGVVYVSDGTNNTIRKITPAGKVSTLAGFAGHFGYRDGLGQAALFNLPKGIAVDDEGNVYVADSNNNTIRKITPRGLVNTLAGTPLIYGAVDGLGSAAQFSVPTGVALDSNGNLFVTDQFNYTIRKITADGKVTTFAGSSSAPFGNDGPGPAASFYAPAGLTIDTANNLWVTDGSAIRKVNPSGFVTTIAGVADTQGSDNGNGTAARFYLPSGISAAPNGNVYIADTFNETIRNLTPAGMVTTTSGSVSPGGAEGSGALAQFNAPQGIAVDSSGNAYVADYFNHVIRKITPTGVTSTFAGSAGNLGSADGVGTAARFAYPRGVAVGGDGVVYVADTSNYTIRKITPNGTVSTIAGLAGFGGTKDGIGSAARFRSPYGLTVDGANNVYVADRSSNTIRKITPAGAVSTIAGMASKRGSADGLGSAARFYSPRAVLADNAGNIFVSDASNHTIRKITPDGIVSTIAGQAGDSGSGDGPALEARFNLPTGLALDRNSNLYVAERGNDTIRKITPAGLVTTLAGKPVVNGTDDGIGDAANFDAPWAVVTDAQGNLLVTDTYSNTLRRGRRVPLSPLELSTNLNAERHLEGTLPPNAEVQITATTDLASPFTYLATVKADAFGIYEYDDLEGASFPKRFYRVSTSSSRQSAVEIRVK